LDFQTSYGSLQGVWGAVLVSILIVWLGLAVLIGVAAHARGRSGVYWFLLALIASPLVAGLFLALMPDLRLRLSLEGEAYKVDDRKLQESIRRGRATRWHTPLYVLRLVIIAAAIAGVYVWLR
jgi:hypothetical protein